MELALKKIFTKDDKKYITMAVTSFDGKKYAFANRIEDDIEDVINEFNVFTEENDEIVYVNDHELINQLLPIFEKKIQDELKKIMKNTNDRGNLNE